MEKEKVKVFLLCTIKKNIFCKDIRTFIAKKLNTLLEESRKCCPWPPDSRKCEPYYGAPKYPYEIHPIRDKFTNYSHNVCPPGYRRYY